MGNANSKNIFPIILFFLSIYVSSAFSERCFLVITLKWRDGRNRSLVDLIHLELSIYFNFKEDCLELRESAKNDEELLMPQSQIKKMHLNLKLEYKKTFLPDSECRMLVPTARSRNLPFLYLLCAH